MPISAEIIVKVAPTVPLYRIHQPNRTKEWPEAVTSASFHVHQRLGETPIIVARRAAAFATRLCMATYFRHLDARRRARAARRARRRQRMIAN